MNTLEVSLDSLARKIKDRHGRAIRLAKNALCYGKEAGEALSEVKSRLPHGQFQSFVRENCPGIGERQVQKYMRLAENWHQIELQIEGQDASINAALKLISSPNANPSSHLDFSGGLIPTAGEVLEGFDRSETDQLYVEIVPSGKKRFYIAVFDLQSLVVDYMERAMNLESVVRFFKKRTANHEFDWSIRTEETGWKHYHPMHDSEEWWAGPNPDSDGYWALDGDDRKRSEFAMNVNEENAFERALFHVKSARKLWQGFNYDCVAIEVIVQRLVKQIAHVSTLHNRPEGDCSKCQRKDGELLGQGVCWRHRYCWPLKKQSGDLGELQREAETLLLSAFFIRNEG